MHNDYGEGDCALYTDLMNDPAIFNRVVEEVGWKQLDLRGGALPRLVAMQGDLGKGEPLYRFPTDKQPDITEFSPAVDEIRQVAERAVGQNLNHALIQLYRDGQDYISEHADKTLDIVHGASIVTVSLGAERLLILRTKDKVNRKSQRIRLPNNSLFSLGLKTNAKWTHSIRQDKRDDREKSENELAFKGQRISITFRTIGTFRVGDRIYGQGAEAKTRGEAVPIVDDKAEKGRLLAAFSRENRTENDSWDDIYGSGFNVVNT